MKMTRLAASVLALALFALPATAQQVDPNTAQAAGGSQQALKDFLADTTPASQLSLPDLRRRITAGRTLLQSHTLDPASQQQVRTAMQTLRAEMQKRQQGAGNGQATQGNGNGQASQSGTQGSDTTAAGQPQTGTGAPANTSAAGIDQFLSDTRPASALSAPELRQRFSQARWPRHDGIAAAAENVRNVVQRLAVDGNGKDSMSGHARLHHRLARIFNAVTALIVIKIIGLAVSDDQQQTAAGAAR
jgi:hypothetical protein